MNEFGFQKSFVQYQEKIKKLKKEYRKIKDKLNETGQGRDEEDAMDQIMGHKPTTMPGSVVESLALS